MQSTGQTSTQALSFTLMQGSAMMYAITASCERHGVLVGDRRRAAKPTYLYQLACEVSSVYAAQSVRSFGSSASRSESPKRLKAKTARLMARPGKTAIQGADSAKSTAAPRSMRP